MLNRSRRINKYLIFNKYKDELKNFYLFLKIIFCFFEDPIGYCPQFDAIFDYMSVYENLDFYAKLKGIPTLKVDKTVTSLMKELKQIENSK